MGINNLTEKLVGGNHYEKLVGGNHYEWRTIVDSIYKGEF